MSNMFPDWFFMPSTHATDHRINIGNIIANSSKNLLNMNRGFIKNSGVYIENNELYVYVGFFYIQTTIKAIEFIVSTLNLLLSTKEDTELITNSLSQFKELCNRLHNKGSYIVNTAALLDIPMFPYLNKYQYLQLGWGKKSKLFLSTSSVNDSFHGVNISMNKVVSKELLQGVGIPTANSIVLNSLDQLEAAANRIGYPCVIKPIRGSRGIGITANIKNYKELLTAFSHAKKSVFGKNPILLEAFIEGFDHRLLVIKGELVAVAERKAAEVVGNGKLTVRELIDELNRMRQSTEKVKGALKQVSIDEFLVRQLEQQTVQLDDVLEKGRVVSLSSIATFATGGTIRDMMAVTHPNIKYMVEKIAEVSGIEFLGVDYITTDISRPYYELNGAVTEYNHLPAMDFLDDFEYSLDIGRKIIGVGSGRIPITLAVVNSNEILKIRDLLSQQEYSSEFGWVCAGHSRIGQFPLKVKQIEGWSTVEMLLKHKTLTEALIVCSIEEIVAKGLPVDKVDYIAMSNVRVANQWHEVFKKATKRIENFETLDALFLSLNKSANYSKVYSSSTMSADLNKKIIKFLSLNSVEEAKKLIVVNSNNGEVFSNKYIDTYTVLIERLIEMKRLADALVVTDVFLLHFEKNEELVYLKAFIYENNKMLSLAMKEYKTLLQQSPKHQLAIARLISLLRNAKLFNEVIPLLQRQLSLEENTRTRHELMKLSFMTKQYHIAEQEAYKVLKKEPLNEDAHFTLASIYNSQNEVKKLSLAIEQYTKIKVFNKIEFLLKIVDFAARICDFDNIKALPNVLEEIEHLPKNTMLLDFLSMTTVRSFVDTPENIMRFMNAQRNLGKIMHLEASDNKINTPFRSSKIATKSSLRYGFMSVLYIPKLVEILAPVFDVLRSIGHEIVFYNITTTAENHKKMSDLLSSHIDEFISINTYNMVDLAKQISSNNLDVLIDLNGYQQPKSCVGVFAWRVAPYQLIWGGIPTPCPFEDVDGQILDPYLIHDSQKGPPAIVLDSAWTSIPAMPQLKIEKTQRDHVVFAVMADPRKIRLQQIEVWAEILKRLPEAKIMFGRKVFLDENIQKNIINAFAQYEIEKNRLQFIDYKKDDFLELYREVDVNLDSFPVHSGITVIEAAWMGVPSVVRCTTEIHHRIGLSVLSNLDIKEGITFNSEDYITQAIELAKDTSNERRIKIREQTANSAFLNNQKFAYDFDSKIKKFINSNITK